MTPAIILNIMITGEGDLTDDGSKIETKKGLGPVNNIIMDQYFIKRQGQNRLIGLMFQYPKLLGLGIDENTAFMI
jgi:cyanophycinase